MAKKEQKHFLILHNIRSAHNVGSIFRTADGVGIVKIYCTGYTPLPVDSFGRAQKDIAKTALGAEKHIVWEHVSSPTRLIRRLHDEHVQIVAIEQDAAAIDYKSFTIQGATAFLLGNEVRGLSRKLIARSDCCIEIPMHGSKESLNVSVATGIVLYRVLDS